MIEKIRSDFSYTKIEGKMTQKSLFSLGFVSILMNLFFIQAMRAYMPGVYVAIFHVVFGENIIQNMLVLLTLIFFFVPGLTVVICKIIKKRNLMIISIFAIVIIRTIMAFNPPSLLLTVCCGLIISFYGFYMSTFLTLWMSEGNNVETSHKMIIFFVSFVSAFLIDYFIRTIGFSQDISLLVSGSIFDWQLSQYFWLIIQIPLSISCIYIALRHFPKFSERNPKEEKEKTGTTMKSYYILIFIGIGIFLFLQFNLFLYPNIIAQYTITSYFFNNIMNILALMIVMCIIIYVKVDYLFKMKIMIILNGFLIISLYLFLFLGKMVTYLGSIFISISLIIIYLDIYILIILMMKIDFKWIKVKSISNIITISLLFYIIFIILHMFTTDWAYTIEAFKGQGPLIIFIAGILFSFTTILSIKLIKKRGNEK